MIVVGLDCAERKHGLVLLTDHQGVVESFYEETIKVPKLANPTEELQWFRDYVSETLYLRARGAPVAIEGPAYGQAQRSHSQGKFRGVIELALYECGHPILDVPPTVLKAYVTGKGSGKKEAMIAAIEAKWGVRYKMSENDRADAYALARFMLAYESNWDEMTVTLRELLSKTVYTEGQTDADDDER